MLTITHTPAEGTLLDGTTRGDGTAEILKATGWRWGRSITAWYLPRTRDQLPQQHKIDRTHNALTAAGFDVELNIDATLRPIEQVEADRSDRSATRVANLEHRADRAGAAADAALAAAHRLLEQLPEGGEPIHVGHYSEGPHRRAIARADKAMRASIDASAAAETAEYRAEAAAARLAPRTAPAQVARRLDRLAVQIRDRRRKFDGYSHTFAGGYVEKHEPATGAYRERIAADLAQLEEQAAYWSGVRAAQIAEGLAVDVDAIKPGDLVSDRYGWATVSRVNKKTIRASGNVRWQTDPVERLIGLADLTGHKPAADS